MRTGTTRRDRHAGFAPLVALAAVAVASMVVSAQQPLPNRAASTALRLRVDTLASFINNVAGLEVRVVDGVVDKIATPRGFTLKHHRSMGPFRVAIVLADGEAAIREGAPVTVTGIARTLLGTEAGPQQPSPALTDKERHRIDALPIVVASAIDTPDGVPLVRPVPADRPAVHNTAVHLE
jgi:hypothetical protein